MDMAADLYIVFWLTVVCILSLLWIRTPLFISANGKRILLMLKICIVLLLIIALCDPKFKTHSVSESFKVVFVIDVSHSVKETILEKVFRKTEEISKTLPENVDRRYVLFDGLPRSFSSTDRIFESPIQMEAIRGLISSRKTRNDTDVGLALEAALREIPHGSQGAVYLFSDGIDHHGNLIKTLDKMADSSIPVSTFRLDSVPSDYEPKIIKIASPREVYYGEEVKVRTMIIHPSGGPVTLNLSVGDGTEITESPVVRPGVNIREFAFMPAKTGDFIITARVQGGRGETARKSGHFSVMHSALRVNTLPRVAIFESDSSESAFLKKALTAEGIEYAAFSPASWPTDINKAIMGFQCIILNNIHSDNFTLSDMKVLHNATQEGTGLLMLGGPNSFGLGGYTGTKIEEALPVKMPTRTLSRDLALILVLDSSGSMAGDGWSYLKIAAKQIVEKCAGQYLGILLFNHGVDWLHRLAPVNDVEDICNELDTAYPIGGTSFFAPLSEAGTALINVPFARKHIIMLSDGNPQDGIYVPQILSQLNQYGIIVSTIAAGDEINSAMLRNIAINTGGNFYTSLIFSELPEIFEREFKQIAGPVFIEEPIKPVIVTQHSAVSGITQSEIPELGGLILTQPKSGAQTVLSGSNAEPLMVFWRYGLGNAAVFTSDFLPAWSSGWAKWDGMGKLLRQMIKELCEGARNKYRLNLRQKGAIFHVSVDTVNDESGSSGIREIRLLDARGEKYSKPLSFDEDGFFSADFRDFPRGIFNCELIGRNMQVMHKTSVFVNDSNEYLPRSPDMSLLGLVADRTGGEVFNDLDEVPQPIVALKKETTIYVRFWPVFVLLALGLYFIDVFLRKINTFGISSRAAMNEQGSSDEIYMQLATKFSNLAQEHSIKGEETEAKRYLLRAKAFYMKAKAVQEANLMWERYRRFDGG